MTSSPKDTTFNTLITHLERMHFRYFHALSAFYVYEGMLEIAAPNIVGKKEAAANAKTMDRYRYFFVISQEALKHYFFLELSKLFDDARESLNIDKIVRFTESNLRKLTVDAFQAHNQDRQLLEELTNKYKGMQYSDVVSIKDLLAKQEKNIEKLRIYRNKWVAHDDTNKPEPPQINAQEIKELFDTVKQVLNMISGKLNNESWSYLNVEGDAKGNVHLVIDHLRQFEQYRLAEINTATLKK